MIVTGTSIGGAARQIVRAQVNGWVNSAAERLNSSKHLRSVKLDKKDGFFGKSDPYFLIKKVLPDGSAVEAMRSKTIKRDLNPSWGWIDFSVQTLAGGDVDRYVAVFSCAAE